MIDWELLDRRIDFDLTNKVHLILRTHQDCGLNTRVGQLQNSSPHVSERHCFFIVMSSI
jgi:hypothetical protein